MRWLGKWNEGHKRNKWHVWFAWYPVSDDDGVRYWLEKVKRKVEFIGSHSWEYRRIEE